MNNKVHASGLLFDRRRPGINRLLYAFISMCRQVYWLNFRLIFTCAIVCISTYTAHAQLNGSTIQVKGDEIIVKIDQRSPDYQLVLNYFGIQEDSLFNEGNIGSILAQQGWRLIELNKRSAKIARLIQPSDGDIYWGSQALIFDFTGAEPLRPGYPGNVAYGVNHLLDNRIIYEDAQGVTHFFLPGNTEATKVILSGNFNDWSTSTPEMTKTDSGWVYTMSIKPGKYLYKYIIDGRWMHDIHNAELEPDGHDGYNSIYFRTNHTMQLSGFTSVQNMMLAGSFNNWDPNEIQMKKNNQGWSLDMYLREGTHTYKYIADGQWMLDPENKNALPDGEGNVNSVMSKGDTSIFQLAGFQDAKVVILSGDFNNWNTASHIMQKTSMGWQLPVVLAPGNYAYKFIVDGTRITDPANPITTGFGQEINSVRMIKPNYVFTLDHYAGAKEVYISGSFINWAEPGYKMTQVQGIWKIPVYLEPGKYTYKFIVDGTWIIDPDNPQWEQNEFGSGNSVLWIESDAYFRE